MSGIGLISKPRFTPAIANSHLCPPTPSHLCPLATGTPVLWQSIVPLPNDFTEDKAFLTKATIQQRDSNPIRGLSVGL